LIRWLLQGGEDQDSEGPKVLRLDDVDKHWWLSRDGSDGLTDAERADFSAFFTPSRPLLLPLFISLVANLGIDIQDPLPQAGLRRKTALPDNLPLDDFLAGKTIEDTMDPERHEAYGVSGPPKEAAPPRDRDRSDNRRVPSHDEPSKKRRRADTVATTTNKTKPQLLAENHALRASQLPVGSQLPVASQFSRKTKAQLLAENYELRAAQTAS
jgi:hypothetical protein